MATLLSDYIKKEEIFYSMSYTTQHKKIEKQFTDLISLLQDRAEHSESDDVYSALVIMGDVMRIRQLYMEAICKLAASPSPPYDFDSCGTAVMAIRDAYVDKLKHPLLDLNNVM